MQVPADTIQVVVYGTVCLDRFVLVDSSGKPIPDRPIRELPGGEAFNTATALEGWGARVLLTGTALGTDAESRRLSALLSDPRVGVPRRLVPVMPSAATPVCTVSLYPDGERRMSGRGYAQAIAPPPLPDDVVSSRPIFAVDPNLGAASIDATLRAAAAGSLVIAMDFLDQADVLAVACIAQTSREWLTRSATFAADDPARAALRLVERGARAAIVTDGGVGSHVAWRDSRSAALRRAYLPAIPAPIVVDTTGAGDMFRAGLCWGLLPRARPWSLLRTVRFASAAAALHCGVVGAGSRPSLSAVLRLARSAAVR